MRPGRRRRAPTPAVQCTVVIGTPTVPGTGTLTITGIDSTTIPQPTRDDQLHLRRAATVAEDVDRVPGADQSRRDQPGRHRAPVHDHGAAGSRRGAGFVAVPDGTTVAVTLSNPATLVSDSCATTGTTVGGTCTVVVDSADPGSVTVTPGAITVLLLDGSGAPAPVDGRRRAPPRTPRPTARRRPGSASASASRRRETNLVGEPHTFTITAEYAIEPGVWQPLTEGEVDVHLDQHGRRRRPADTTCPTLAPTARARSRCRRPSPARERSKSRASQSATVTVGGVPTTFTDVNVTTAPDAVEFTTPTATKTWAAYLRDDHAVGEQPGGHRSTISSITATRTDGRRRCRWWARRSRSPGPARARSSPPSPCTTDAAGHVHGECDLAGVGHRHADGDEPDRRRFRRGPDGAGRAGSGAGPGRCR